MTPFAYATPYSNAPYTERDRRSSIGIYEDEDEDQDADYVYKREEGSDVEGEEGSTTDDLYADDVNGGEVGDEDEDEGGEANALSDFSSDGVDVDEDIDVDNAEVGHWDEEERQLDEEWEGVQDDLDLDLDISHAPSSSHHGYSPRLLPASKDQVISAFRRHELELATHENETQNDEMDDIDDQASDISSVPSEYPSRQPEGLFDFGYEAGLGMSTGKPGFRIHVDEEME